MNGSEASRQFAQLGSQTFNISKYLAIPYKDRGNSFDGVDCYGLLKLFYKEEFGIELIDYKNEIKMCDEERYHALISDNIGNEFEEVNNADIGDMVMLFNSNGIATHVGIVISNNKILHATDGSICTANLNAIKRKGNGVFYRLKGFNNENPTT
jgi:cell wall-associated NlpC family hydrolase